MALAVDSSSPVRWSAVTADNADTTSASFTPPSGSLLVAAVEGDFNDGPPPLDPTFVVATSGLTWTLQTKRTPLEGGSSSQGYASLWTAPVVTGAAMTIAVRRTTTSGGTDRVSCKAYVVTGQHASPIGNVAENSSTTNNLTASGLTSAAANSMMFVAATDWAQLGVPVSSDLTEDVADYSGAISVVDGYKLLGGAGAQTANLDAGGSGTAQWNWCALEIKEATGAETITVDKWYYSNPDARRSNQIVSY